MHISGDTSNSLNYDLDLGNAMFCTSTVFIGFTETSKIYYYVVCKKHKLKVFNLEMLLGDGFLWFEQGLFGVSDWMMVSDGLNMASFESLIGWWFPMAWTWLISSLIGWWFPMVWTWLILSLWLDDCFLWFEPGLFRVSDWMVVSYGLNMAYFNKTQVNLDGVWLLNSVLLVSSLKILYLLKTFWQHLVYAFILILYDM